MELALPEGTRAIWGIMLARKALKVNSPTRKTVGIIGGGPAGLSMARMLRDAGQVDATVFEALPQVGGKSFTFYHGDNVDEPAARTAL